MNELHSGGGPRGKWRGGGGRPLAVPLAVGDRAGTYSVCCQSTDVRGEREPLRTRKNVFRCFGRAPGPSSPTARRSPRRAVTCQVSLVTRDVSSN